MNLNPQDGSPAAGAALPAAPKVAGQQHRKPDPPKVTPAPCTGACQGCRKRESP